MLTSKYINLVRTLTLAHNIDGKVVHLLHAPN